MRKSRAKKIAKRKTQKRVGQPAKRAHTKEPSSSGVAELHSRAIETKLSQLAKAKQSFLSAMEEREPKAATPAEKLNRLVAKAEQLASFLITKHRFFESFN
jgi:hypothetical protein